MDDENSEDLLHYMNSLKVLQDRTASRDQFSCQRMKIYNVSLSYHIVNRVTDGSSIE